METKPFRFHYFTFILFIYLSFPALAIEEIHHMEKSTQQASDLTKRMTIADPAEKIILLEKLKILVAENPDNIWVRKMYVNNLIAEKHYHQGLAGSAGCVHVKRAFRAQG